MAKVATSDTDANRCLVPRTASFGAIENEEEAVKSVEPVDELKSLNEAKNISSTTDNLDVEIESHFTSDDQFLTFSVTNDSQIHFQIGDDVCTVTVSNSWSIVESSTEQKFLMLSQIVSNAANNGDIAVIRKGIVIDNKRRIKYAIHGKLVKHDVPQLAQELTDPRILPNILNEFHDLHVCDGLRDANINLVESVAVYKDNVNMNRSTTKCMLIGKKNTCNFCTRLRRTLLQKNFRYTKHDKFKRFAALSNPVDQRKFNAMRLKINRERRAKNRRMRRMKILSAYLRQKQDEFAAIKDHLLEEWCAMLHIPEVQKNALRQIVAAAKQKDLRGRRYTKDWIMMCMLMNIRSPAYYEFIRKNEIIPLPCTRTVRNYFSLIDSKCGVDNKFFELLKLKFQSKDPMQRHGLVVCDEINLRKSLAVSSKDLTYAGLTDFGNDGPRATDIDDQATHGLVLLFQSLADKFTQPIAVFASKNPVKGDELAKLMVKAIILLEQSGALIHGIIADGAQTNTKMGTILGIDRTIDNCNSWFPHPLDNERRVFVFSDIPHLIKNVRNRLHNKQKLRV